MFLKLLLLITSADQSAFIHVDFHLVSHSKILLKKDAISVIITIIKRNRQCKTGAVTQPYRYKGALQSTNSGVCIAKQIGLESSFKRIN